MSTPEINKTKRKITKILNKYAKVSPSRSRGLLNINELVGKLYEASVLAEVIEKIVKEENLRVTLVANGNKLRFRQKGGSIDRNFPYFQIWRDGNLFAELFMDVYFKTLSSIQRTVSSGDNRADYHELDLAIILPDVQDHPSPEEIMIAIECKNTTLKKSTMRELLGFRRELSYLSNSEQTVFKKWPAKFINANPASVHMLYTTHSGILENYRSNFDVFGIILIHHRM
ncbi:hypothetical protein [Flavobacterium piscisymbiosum]|uniref:Restriction endonuclease n=1 Tax=Flavobacterium piscisymbiosum TaxID=2893753 RepID=A0ABS8MDP2_9FLAO|nr:hypothetical protein [Flavobacterium sp. F-30]MCC9063596.1 hypothetical protein [Flavobacterium sp. F-30]